MIVFPIRTESPIHRIPRVNYALICANVLVFLLVNAGLTGKVISGRASDLLGLHSLEPALYQFVTYQFLHGDVWHLLGNMLFLWVFGNSVNAKMGDWAYLLFYVAGGIFAAWGYAVMENEQFVLMGASGAIAAITTAYMVLFPRSRVTVLFWVFFFVHLYRLPAMVIIGVKIILWDNMIAPRIGPSGSIAYWAHLSGYLFGFAGAAGMLLIGALPRDRFDMLALWKRWRRRRVYASEMSDPEASARAGDGGGCGPVARVAPADPQVRAVEEEQLDEVSQLRARIAAHFELGESADAANLYEQLIAQDPKQCLSERFQMKVAREFYSDGRFPQAAAAFDRLISSYPYSHGADEVRLLLGIIYARDLRQYEAADKLLTEALGRVTDRARRRQCAGWLRDVRAALGRPAFDLDV